MARAMAGVPRRLRAPFTYEMKKVAFTSGLMGPADTKNAEALPTPSMRFRRRAWLSFQRALDPLAAPKKLPTRRPH
jgi:hypothetical protein